MYRFFGIFIGAVFFHLSISRAYTFLIFILLVIPNSIFHDCHCWISVIEYLWFHFRLFQSDGQFQLKALYLYFVEFLFIHLTNSCAVDCGASCFLDHRILLRKDMTFSNIHLLVISLTLSFEACYMHPVFRRNFEKQGR